MTSPAAAGELFAGQVTAEDAARVLPGGPDGVGGIGDYALGNGTLCAVISHPSQGTDVSPQGGFLLDLGHCGAGNDQLGNLIPMLNVSRENIPVVDTVETSVAAGEARVVTHARWEGFAVETVYALDLAAPERLRMETRVRRVGSGGRLSVLGLLSVHPNATLRAFTFDTEHAELASGFSHPPTPDENLRALLAGLGRANVQVLVSDDGTTEGIAYGIRVAEASRIDEDGEARPLPAVALNGAPFTLLGVFSRPFWFGGGLRIGLVELFQALFMNLPEEESLRVVHEIHVGSRGDVASVTDQLWPEGPRVEGVLDDAKARIHVRAEGLPVTQVRPGADGRFAFHVPAAGAYELRAVAAGGREIRLPVDVAAEGAALGRVSLGEKARLRLPRGHAMRLVFEGLEGTPAPRFGDDLLGVRFGEDEPPASSLASYVSLAGTADDPAFVTLRPGRYRIYATRGLEWSVEQTEVSVRAGEDTSLAIGLPRHLVPTPGWILADLHVHAGGSFDSTLPYRERLRSFVAQGGEVLVATEHDHVVDYRPLVGEMGLAERLRVIPGLEATSISRTEAVPFSAGHANVLPLEPTPFAHRGGALRSQGVRPRDMIAELRERGGRRLYQLNHPRMRGPEANDEAFFTHQGVAGAPHDPTQPLDSLANRNLIDPDPETGVRDIDFDAVELLNGRNGPALAYFKQTRADWLSLMLQGERRTATANSDSHKHRQLVAIPANYVRVEEDRAARLDEGAFVEALFAGAVVGTTGPFLDVSLAGVGPGGTFRGAEAELEVTVLAADWIPVNELRVYVDGRLETRQPVRAGETVRIPLAFEADAFVTVEVQGNARGDGGEGYRAVAPGFIPFAFSNPVFVDADGDGHFLAPGLVEPLPPTLTDPLGS